VSGKYFIFYILSISQSDLSYWDFHAQPLLGFTKDGVKREKHSILQIQFARDHQNWTVEDWKNIAWSESRFLLRHSDGRVRIWRKQNEKIDPSCLVTTVQAAGGGVMVWGMFSWHTLGPSVSANWACKCKCHDI